MKDPRVEKLASVLVDYSTRVKKGDIVLVHCNGTAAVPLMKEVYSLCLERGAGYVEYQISLSDMGRVFYDNASEDQLGYFPDHKFEFMKKADVFIGISAVENSMELANSRQDSMIKHEKVIRPILDERVDNCRWVICRYPTYGAAQDAAMSLDEYEDFLFSACNIDYAKASEKQERLKKMMEKASDVRIVASDTDINFSIKGMPAIKCDGRRNIPDGEVYTAPVRDSVEGFITYNCPSIYQGKEFSSVRLEFSAGKIVSATSPGMDEELNKILDTDEGARHIGEFSMGTNPNITRPMRNTLFDEKISGSIHLTPGKCYDICDNGNKSAIHWDLVKILKGDGEIYFDNELIQKDGIFVHEELEELNEL